MISTKFNNDFFKDGIAFPKNRTKNYEVRTLYKAIIAGVTVQILSCIFEGHTTKKQESRRNEKSFCYQELLDRVKTKTDQNNSFFHA